MITRRTLALAAAITGCGPTTINVTTSGAEGAGEESTSTGGVHVHGSTGLGGPGSGHLDDGTFSGGDYEGSTSVTSASDTGGGSSSTGGPLPVCLDPATGECSCAITMADGQCMCGDEVVAPSYCASTCEVFPPGLTCICDGAPTDPMATPGGCLCGDVVMNPAACWCQGECACQAVGALCVCDFGSAPLGYCVDTCGYVGDACYCNGEPATDDQCTG